jgi:hypothetical protein
MTVTEFILFLSTQPPNALVLIASRKQTFGDTRVELRGDHFTYANCEDWMLSRMVIHPDDEDITNEPLVPVITIGCPL